LAVSIGILLLVLAIGGPIVAAKESHAKRMEIAARMRADEEAERVRLLYRKAEEHTTNAIELLESMLSEMPNDASYRVRVADIYSDLAWFLTTSPDLRLRDPLHAEELAAMAVARAPDSVVCWRTLGAAHYRNGRWSDSIDAMEKCNRLNADSGGPEWAFAAMAYSELGDSKQALVWMNRYAVWLQNQDSSTIEWQTLLEETREMLGISRNE